VLVADLIYDDADLDVEHAAGKTDLPTAAAEMLGAPVASTDVEQDA
jgi:hypothetical protein